MHYDLIKIFCLKLTLNSCITVIATFISKPNVLLLRTYQNKFNIFLILSISEDKNNKHNFKNSSQFRFMCLFFIILHTNLKKLFFSHKKKYFISYLFLFIEIICFSDGSISSCVNLKNLLFFYYIYI